MVLNLKHHHVVDKIEHPRHLLLMHLMQMSHASNTIIDTDVAVIAVSLFRDLGADEIWLAFGSWQSF